MVAKGRFIGFIGDQGKGGAWHGQQRRRGTWTDRSRTQAHGPLVWVPTMSGHESARNKPAGFPRRVLLAVSGLSPQIVTETLYALAVAAPQDQRFIPTEIEVVTTAEGAQRVRRHLLADEDGAFARLCRDYGLPPIAFDAARVRTVRGADGKPLADIRSAEDNACLADAITARVRELTADDSCALHVSLAGGRKTMGYYAGYALSLFGRAQDRLSHVLVNEPFESAPEFWYPRPRPELLRLRAQPGLLGGQCDAADDAATAPGPAGPASTRHTADTADARVSLAMIPFVRLRQGLPRALLEGRSGFAETVAAAGDALAPPRLRLHLQARTVEADGQRIVLQPAPFAFLAALASRALHGRPALPAPPKEVHDPAWAAEVVSDLRRAYGLMHVPAGLEASLLADCSGTKVSPMVSRLRRGLAQGLAASRVGLYFDDGGSHRHKRYAVPLPAGAIELVAVGGGGKLADREQTAPERHTEPA